MPQFFISTITLQRSFKTHFFQTYSKYYHQQASGMFLLQTVTYGVRCAHQLLHRTMAHFEESMFTVRLLMKI